VARALDLTLTTRDKGKWKIPSDVRGSHHGARLLAKLTGCTGSRSVSSSEDPRTVKGIVKRDVIRGHRGGASRGVRPAHAELRGRRLGDPRRGYGLAFLDARRATRATEAATADALLEEIGRVCRGAALEQGTKGTDDGGPASSSGSCALPGPGLVPAATRGRASRVLEVGLRLRLLEQRLAPRSRWPPCCAMRGDPARGGAPVARLELYARTIPLITTSRRRHLELTGRCRRRRPARHRGARRDEERDGRASLRRWLLFPSVDLKIIRAPPRRGRAARRSHAARDRARKAGGRRRPRAPSGRARPAWRPLWRSAVPAARWRGCRAAAAPTTARAATRRRRGRRGDLPRPRRPRRIWRARVARRGAAARPPTDAPALTKDGGYVNPRRPS
jgi:hypothetical protein